MTVENLPTDENDLDALDRGQKPSEDPNRSKIVLELSLLEVSGVPVGGHQNAHISLTRALAKNDAGQKRDLPVHQHNAHRKAPHMSKALVILGALVAASMPVTTTANLNRSGLTFGEIEKQRDIEEKMDRMIGSFYRSLYSILGNSTEPKDMAETIKRSCDEFAEAIDREFKSVATPSEQMERTVASSLENVKNVLEAVEAKNKASLQRAVEKLASSNAEKPNTKTKVVNSNHYNDDDDDISILRTSIANASDADKPRLQAALQRAEQMQNERVELQRRLAALEKDKEDTEIRRVMAPYFGKVPNINDAEFMNFYRLAAENNQVSTLNKILQYTQKVSDALLGEVGAPAGALQRHASVNSVMDIVNSEATKLMQESPQKFTSMAIARSHIWAIKPELKKQYEDEKKKNLRQNIGL